MTPGCRQPAAGRSGGRDRRRRSSSARRTARRRPPRSRCAPPARRSSTLTTPTISRPASCSASIAAIVEPPVVTTSSTTTQRSSASSTGPSMRRCRPWPLASLRTKKPFALAAAGERRAGDRVGAHRHAADRGRVPAPHALGGDQLAERPEPGRPQDRPLGVDVVLGRRAARQHHVADAPARARAARRRGPGRARRSPVVDVDRRADPDPVEDRTPRRGRAPAGSRGWPRSVGTSA